MRKRLSLSQALILAAFIIALEYVIFSGVIWIIAYLLEFTFSWKISSAIYLISKLISYTFNGKISNKG